MSESTSSSDGGGCGCLTLILTILALWALWFGLPVPGGVLNIDIIPPAIHLIKP
jgi:hypothetical protein